ncbi:hypothetical protein JW826_02510 [Candidatus Woesearchaeota archaeon]|nr:hypothetical protein [Candidatus Woesearchaeota archaeon]
MQKANLADQDAAVVWFAHLPQENAGKQIAVLKEKRQILISAVVPGWKNAQMAFAILPAASLMKALPVATAGGYPAAAHA